MALARLLASGYSASFEGELALPNGRTAQANLAPVTSTFGEPIG